MEVRACLVDVDGTAVLSEHRNRSSIEEVARDGGFTITKDHWEHGYAGAGDEVIWQKICDERPSFINSYPTAASFENACLDAYSRGINQIQANKPVRDLVNCFRKSNIKIGAVSNSLARVVDENLRHAKYPVDEFNIIVCKDEVRAAGLNTKPAPDPYILALEKLNGQLPEGTAPIKPEECLILEDSKTGARSGLKFGATVIQLLDDDTALARKETKSLTNEFNGTYHGCLLNTLHHVCDSILNGKSDWIKVAARTPS